MGHDRADLHRRQRADRGRRRHRRRSPVAVRRQRLPERRSREGQLPHRDHVARRDQAGAVDDGAHRPARRPPRRQADARVQGRGRGAPAGRHHHHRLRRQVRRLARRQDAVLRHRSTACSRSTSISATATCSRRTGRRSRCWAASSPGSACWRRRWSPSASRSPSPCAARITTSTARAARCRPTRSVSTIGWSRTSPPAARRSRWCPT